MDAEDAAVCWDTVTYCDNNDISGNKFVCLDSSNLAIAVDLGLVGTVLLKRGNGLFGRGFLRDTDDGVEDEDSEDDYRVDKGGPVISVLE